MIKKYFSLFLACLSAVGLTLCGLHSVQVFLPDKDATYSIQLQSGTNMYMIDSSVVKSFKNTDITVASPKGKVLVAICEKRDALAWIGDREYTDIKQLTSTKSITEKAKGDSSAEKIKGYTKDQSITDVKDLWADYASGKNTATINWSEDFSETNEGNWVVVAGVDNKAIADEDANSIIENTSLEFVTKVSYDFFALFIVSLLAFFVSFFIYMFTFLQGRSPSRPRHSDENYITRVANKESVLEKRVKKVENRKKHKKGRDPEAKQPNSDDDKKPKGADSQKGEMSSQTNEKSSKTNTATAKAESKSETKVDSKAERVKIKTEAKAAKAESKSETKVDSKAERVKTKTEAKAAKAEAKAEAKAAKTEARASKAEAKAEAKAAKAEARASKAKAKAETEAEAKSDSQKRRERRKAHRRTKHDSKRSAR